MKLYLAGALFNEAEIAQRLKEGKLLNERFGEKLSIFNPIEQPFNANKYEIPSYAMNHYVLGGVLKHGKLVYSFEEALDELESLFCLSKKI